MRCDSAMIAAFDSRTRADELVDTLADDVLRAVDECDHGVGRRFDAFDEIGVQRERRTVGERVTVIIDPSLDLVGGPSRPWPTYRHPHRTGEGKRATREEGPAAARAPGVAGPVFPTSPRGQRLRFTRSWRSSSEVVITLALASKPRCATIMFVNS